MTSKHPQSTRKAKNNTQQEFELPDASEKQTHKFILDGLREKMLKQESMPHTSEIATQAAIHEVIEAVEAAARQKSLDLPKGKNYFRVREVAALINVGPHVLRFWETEFSMVRPTKSRSGQRVYRRKDVEILGRIRHLLHEQKLSIKAAREILLQERREKAHQHSAAPHSHKHPRPHAPAQSEQERHLDLKEMLVDLRNIIKICQQDPFSFHA